MSEMSSEEGALLQGEIRSARKAEWGVIIALTINVITAAFGVGVYFNTISEQGRRITQLESERALSQTALNQQGLLLARIEGDVKYLRERAEEDRRVIYQRRGL